MAVQHVPVSGPLPLSMMACVEAKRCVASQPAPPPQQTESSIVTLQSPCTEPGSSAGHCQPTAQEPGGRSPQPACLLPMGYDECDKCLDKLDTRKEVRQIFIEAPSKKQVMMFSATMTSETRGLCKKFISDPHEIRVDEESSPVLFEVD